MQACFFKLSGVLPEAEAIALMKKAVEKTYGRKGKDVVQMNWDAIDRAAAALEAVPVPAKITKFGPGHQDRPGRRQRLRQGGHRPGHPVQGRPAARLQDAPRRGHPDGHGPARKARHRHRMPPVAPRELHPVQPVQLRLPPRHDPGQADRARPTSPAPPTASSPSSPTPRTTAASCTASSATSRTASAAARAPRSARPRSRPWS